MSTLAITLQHPAKELRPNRDKPQTVRGLKASMAAYMRAKKQAKTDARLLTLHELNGRQFIPEGYRLLWRYKGPRPDVDNCLASCKPYLDGICAALKIDDGLLECDGIRREHTLDDDAGKTLQLEFAGRWADEHVLTDAELADIMDDCYSTAHKVLHVIPASTAAVAASILQQYYLAQRFAPVVPHIARRYEALRSTMEQAGILQELDTVKGGAQ